MKRSILVLLSSLLGISLFFLSCDLMTDPERFIDQSVTSPSAETIQFNNLVPGQHVDGTIQFSIDTSVIGFEIIGVGLFVDDVQYNYYQNINNSFYIETRNHSEGLHTIGLGFYKSNPNHGVMNLFFPPSLYLKTEIYFDRTLPAEIPIIASQDTSGFTIISWTESPNDNFLKYEILKSYDGINWQTVKTIKTKNITSIVDSVDFVLNGIEVKYKLIHSTGATSSESNIITHYVGQELKYELNQINLSKSLISNQILNEVYFTFDGKMACFSSIDNSLKKEMLLPGVQGGPPSTSFSLSNDGQRIFIYKNYGRKLLIVNADVFYIIRSVTLNVPEELRTESDEIIHVDQNKILLFGKYEKIRLVDYNENNVLDSLIIPNTDITCAAISNDKSKLIIALIEKNISPNIYKIQIRNLNLAGFPILAEIVTNAPSYNLKITPDDQKLVELSAQRTRLNLRDINSLNVLSFINAEQEKTIGDFVLSDNKIYSYQPYSIVFNGNNKLVYKLTRYDINFLNPETSQYLTNVLSYKVELCGNNLYLCTSSPLDQKNIVGLFVKK